MTWRILSKEVRKERDGQSLVLVVERKGQKREMVVSGKTWEEKKVGDAI
jgi:hypothetical protein